MNTFTKIAREPSSWAGFAAILQGVALIVPQYGAVINGLSMLFGGLAVTVREKGPAPTAGNPEYLNLN